MNNLELMLVESVVKILVVVIALTGAAALVIMADRRLSAFIQDRLGPNRVGPEGLLQPIADFIKLIFKEDFTPAEVDKPFYNLAPVMILIPALVTIAVIPFGDTLTVAGYTFRLQLADLNIGLLYIFALTSLGVYGIVLGGWSANNKYTMFGALRSTAQMISYELSLGLSAVGVLLISNSLQLSTIVEDQTTMLWGILPRWNIFLQPLGFVLFLISIFAETNRLPFDLPEAEQELVGGYHTEYSSMKFASYYLAEYCNLIVASALIVTLFFGGWHVPYLENISMPLLAKQLVQVGGFVVKTALFTVLFVWVRWTLPRFKYNQLMNIGWKALIPLALANVVVTAIVIAMAK